MGIEETSSLENDQETAETLQASSDPPPDAPIKCDHDGQCPPGYHCVNGECVPE